MTASMPVLRPGPTGLKRMVGQGVMAMMPAVFAFFRRFWPIPHFGKYYAVTRHDDVREVFDTDAVFGVVYKPKLDVMMDGQPFILGMADGPDYREDLAALRQVVRKDDLPVLASRVETMAQNIVAAANGRIEVVDQLVRQVAFTFLQEYLGIPDLPNMQAWCTRLFEYQFVSSDAPLVEEAKQVAPALRAHIQGEIERRRANSVGGDDVLARCLALQAGCAHGFRDEQIRTGLMGLLVGGPPQPPMVVPQALEQLLRRPDALRGAMDAARRSDDTALAAYVREAMRFDPLAPGLPRVVLQDWTIARGTVHQKAVPKGATVLAAFASAMMDGDRVPEPQRFDISRQPHEYIHFGHGLHQCFGLYINQATLHLMLKPLLARTNLRRAAGSLGHLRKSGVFAASLVVEFD
jgi:cytochrome P450